MLDNTLSWLSKVLKLDARYIAAGGFFLTLTQITSALIGLGMTVAFANLIPVETYGTYRYILALYGLFALGTLPGLDTAVTQSVINNFDGSLKEGFRNKIKYGLTALVATLIYASYLLFFKGNNELAYLLFMMAFALPIMEAGTVGVAFMNGKKLFREWARIDVVTQIVSAATLVTIMFFTQNIFLLTLAYFLPYITLRTYTVLFYLKPYQDNQNKDPGMLPYGKRMTGFNITTRIVSSVDQIVLFHFLGPVQVAIFTLAQAIPMRIQSLLKISGILAMPKFAGKTHQESANLLLKKMVLFGFFILLGCFAFVLLAPLIFSTLLPKYIASIKYSQVLVFYTLSAVSYPFSSLLSVNKKIKENYIVSIVAFIAKILSLIFLVPLFGVWGAVWGVLISSLLGTLTSVVLLIRASKETPAIFSVQ